VCCGDVGCIGEMYFVLVMLFVLVFGDMVWFGVGHVICVGVNGRVSVVGVDDVGVGVAVATYGCR